MKQLNPKIIEIIHKKTGKAIPTIRKNISLKKREYPRCTLNAVAQIYATELGFSVMQKLDSDDKTCLPHLQIEKPVKITSKRITQKVTPEVIFDYDTSDYFISGHISELNLGYNAKCYTSTYILIRKVIENLLIDILRKKYPESGGSSNVSLYYNPAQKRFHDFSVILDNLFSKRNDFGIDGTKIIARLNQLCVPMKKDANDKAHSWFHLVESKQEIKDINVSQLINLIKKLEKSVGIR